MKINTENKTLKVKTDTSKDVYLESVCQNCGQPKDMHDIVNPCKKFESEDDADKLVDRAIEKAFGKPEEVGEDG